MGKHHHGKRCEGRLKVVCGMTFQEANRPTHVMLIKSRVPGTNPLGIHGQQFVFWPNSIFAMFGWKFHQHYTHETLYKDNYSKVMRFAVVSQI